MGRLCLAMCVGLLVACPAEGGSWADALFDGLTRDFGTVPRGPTLTHAFHVTNRMGQPVHIAGVRVSCGCLTAGAQKLDLAPGESTAVIAEMDTRRFSGPKSVTVYVQFDRPAWEEVRLQVHANGRDDVNFAPESFSFGQARKGGTPQTTVNLALFGSSEWRVTDIASSSNYVSTSVQETKRSANEVTYQLTAQVRGDCPVGKWYTDVWVTTNNPATPRIRVPLTIEIQPSLMVSPSIADLGQVKTGEEAEKKIIVRGSQPFRISAIEGSDAQVTVRDTTDGSKPVHVLSVKLKGDRVGEIKRSLRVVTDLADEGSVEFQAIAQIIP